MNYTILLVNTSIVHFLTQDGWTALVIAAQNGRMESVRTLIHAGADVSLAGQVHHLSRTMYTVIVF
jgi:ankyrin repeat protein